MPALPVLDGTTVPIAPRRSDGRITAPLLVDAAWLLAQDDACRVIDTRAAGEYAAGHVAGAISLPLDALLVDDTSRPALERLGRAVQQLLGERGIAPTDHVVLVDDADGSAALGATICELAGLRHVTVVHGSGVIGWAALGGVLANGEPAAVEPADLGAWAQTPLRLTLVAAFEDLVDAVVDGSARIIDARSQLEHEGIIGPSCCGGRGAIPGSIHMEWTELLSISGGPCSRERAREVTAHVGIDEDDPIIVACHGGHRAARTARMLRAVGFRNVRVSLGSWHEWSRRELGGDEAEQD